MKLCRVLGEVVSTVHHAAFDGHKLLVVEPTDATGKGIGKSFLAIDNVQAGVGEWVLILSEGNGAAQVLASKRGPVRSVIVGIVDMVTRGDA